MSDFCSDFIWGHVKGINDHYAISEGELRFILSSTKYLPAQPCILELGVCHGRTFAALTLLAMIGGGSASGIDHFGLEGSPAEIHDTFKTLGLLRWSLIVANTHNSGWCAPIDLLVIDAGHDELNVRPDIEIYVPLVKSGGVVFFDDYDDPYDPQSPHWAVRHYADLACAGWEDLGIVEGVRGWRKP